MHLYRHGAISSTVALHHAISYMLHYLGHYSIPEAHQIIFKRLFQGQPAQPFKNFAAEFVQEQWHQLVYAPARQCLQAAKQQGHYTVILSSAPSFLVKLLAERFNVDAWDATHYDTDSTGRFNAISKWMLSESKAQYVNDVVKRFGITKQQVTVYSDSIQDLAFLESAGTSIGVNPDRALRKICKRNHWTIL
jgi:HAD superfamily phosphoserine phosphatase-like hydrolase